LACKLRRGDAQRINRDWLILVANQHDAYAVAAWMREADQDGRLAHFFSPVLTPSEKAIAQVEGWILGVR
jgi:hypothetical protein